MVTMVRKVVVAAVGAVLVLLGLAMLVLPGPGFLAIAAGLAVLATEYVWAHRLLAMSRDRAMRVQKQTVASPLRTAGTIACGLVLVGCGVVLAVVDDLPFAGPWSAGAMVFGGVAVITLTVLTILLVPREPADGER